ncbi:acetoacetate decarboxylase family protein [Pseudonocardia ailaonensis]|uniref:Acetoacetate decarboxylase family protein n=1 Tax=Pseudonocardia ailaonensis TaxID=367279 RepID=A0ABN2MIX6_9PSEU
MSYRLHTGVRYDMPVAFGPSPARDDELGYTVHGAALGFVTEREALEPLVPPGLEVPDRPVVTVNYQQCRNMTWMGGRGYNLVSVYASAIYRRAGHAVAAPLGLVIWESDCAPIIVGREFLGTPKIHGQIPDADVSRESFGFSVAEYGSPLLSGSCSAMTPAAERTFDRIAAAGRDMVRLHWKYIPGVGDEPDADYPVAMHARTEYQRIWTGTGSLTVGSPDEVAAPYSSRAARALGRLPVVETRPAVALHATVDLLRSRTARLDRDDAALAALAGTA